MDKPTARELVAAIWDGSRPGSPMELADRVEAVLALPEVDYTADSQAGGYNAALRDVLRLLNGEAE